MCDYLAQKAPNECMEVLENSGHTFDKPKSTAELSQLLHQYIGLDKERALKKLAEIHPDKELCQSVDRPVMERDYQGQQAINMFGQGYSSPYYPNNNYTLGGMQQLPQMTGQHHFGFAGGHMSACGCSHMSSNGDTGCGCKNKGYNADGEMDKTNKMLWLVMFGLIAYVLVKVDFKKG